MTEQLDLLSYRPAGRSPEFYQLVEFLKDGAWRTRRQIHTALGLNDRTVRIVAEESEGWIISGPKGFRYLPKAQPADVDQFTATMISQGRKMIRRALATKKLYHSLVG
jgi:hypothetical protein